MNSSNPSSDSEPPEHERSVFAMAPPRIAQGLQTAADLIQFKLQLDRRQATEAFIPPLLHVSAKGKILWASSPALRLLRAYLDWTDESSKLPAPLLQMICLSSHTDESSPTQLRKEEWIVGRQGRALHVRLIEDNRRLWFVLDERSPSVPLPAHGLTKREAEVLQWLAAGKSNKDIGTILAISPRTVEKHVERIFQYLGVETRTAAAAEFYRLNQHVPTS